MQVNYAPIDSNEAPPPASNTDNTSQGGRFSRKKLLIAGGAILTVAIMFISFHPAANRRVFSPSSRLASRMPAPLMEAPSHSVLYSAGMGMIHPVLVRRFGLSPPAVHTNVSRSIFAQPRILSQAPVRVGYAAYVPINNNAHVNPFTADKMAAVSAAHVAAEAAKKRAAVFAQLNSHRRYPYPASHFTAPSTVQHMPMPPAQAHYVAYLKSKAQAAPVSEATAAKTVNDPVLKETMKLAAIPKPVV